MCHLNLEQKRLVKKNYFPYLFILIKLLHIIYFVHIQHRNRTLFQTSFRILMLLKENRIKFWDSRSANYQNLKSQILGLCLDMTEDVDWDVKQHSNKQSPVTKLEKKC